MSVQDLKPGKAKCIQRLVRPAFQRGKWTQSTEYREVVLMALSGKWAMVRRPGCVPFVVYLTDLLTIEEAKAEQEAQEVKS